MKASEDDRRGGRGCSSLHLNRKLLFMQIANCEFFETFKEFEGRAFHMAGESYGVSRFDPREID